MRVIWPFSAKHLDCFGGPLMSVIGGSEYVALEELNQKGHGKPVDLWSIGYSHFLPPLIIHTIDGMLITCGRIITYILFADMRCRHSRQIR